MIASGIYEGTIRHRRHHPRREFTHRLALAYVDLKELPDLLNGRLVASRHGLVRFRRRDYLGDSEVPLEEAVRSLVADRTGRRPDGAIRILTQLRSLGHCFNPVSFYYCFDPEADRLQALVAEVTNTPWGERHAYVLSASSRASSVLEGEADKALHVSPFMSMNHRYTVRASTPGRTLSVNIASRNGERQVFDATLALHRRELTARSLAGVTARYPLATLRVLALIYLHALGLKLAGAPVHPHRPAEAG